MKNEDEGRHLLGMDSLAHACLNPVRACIDPLVSQALLSGGETSARQVLLDLRAHQLLSFSDASVDDVLSYYIEQNRTGDEHEPALSIAA